MAYLQKTVFISFDRQKYPLAPLTPESISTLESIAHQLANGRFPYDDIYQSLGQLLSLQTRDALFPHFLSADCHAMLSLWLAACHAALHRLRLHRQSYRKDLRRLSRRRLLP